MSDHVILSFKNSVLNNPNLPQKIEFASASEKAENIGKVELTYEKLSTGEYGIKIKAFTVSGLSSSTMFLEKGSREDVRRFLNNNDFEKNIYDFILGASKRLNDKGFI